MRDSPHSVVDAHRFEIDMTVCADYNPFLERTI
jgi:hypothetical protein